MAEHETNLRRIFTTSLGNLGPQLSAVATIPILAQSLGPIGRGEAAAISAPFILFMTIGTFGLPEATNYYVARLPTNALRVLRTCAPMSVLTGVAAGGVLALLSGFFAGGEKGLIAGIVISALCVPLAAFVALLRGMAQGLHRWRTVAWERLISALARLLGLLTLALTGSLTPVFAAYVIVASYVIGGCAYIGKWQTSNEFAPDGAEQPSLSNLGAYGLRIWVGAISGVLLSRLDQALMTPLASAYELGLYAIAVSVSELPLVVNAAVRDVMFSTDAGAQDNSVLQSSARISTLICTSIAAFIALTIPFWLVPVLGVRFVPVVPTMILLLAAVAVGTPGSVAGAALSARGWPGLRSGSLVIACVVNVVLVILLVPTGGAFAAAVATLCGNLISSNANILALRIRSGVRILGFYGLTRSDASTIAQSVLRLAHRTVKA